MIYRVLYDGVDIHTNSVPDVLINPTVETEMNTAGSFTFTLPPDHFAWGDIYVFKGNVEVYENNDLIFFGRVANVDQNWNNERVVECEGALAFFNDSIQRPNSWTSNTLISQFLSDILDNHNAQVPDNRKIYLGNVTIDDMYVTRETNYEKTLDVLTRMCIDTNGGYFSLRKDEDDGKIYLDWLKDLTDVAAQPVEFGLNLLDISRSLHAEDIVTGVLARGGEVNDVKIDLHEVEEIDDPSIPVIHHTNQDPDILWHRDGLEGYGRVVQVKEFNDCTTVDGDNGLLAKATEWLIKQNTDIDTIEVDAAELGYFGESYPIFLLGQKVLVNSHPHHLENVELPMYKISMNLDSGTKRISIGTPPKRELTQISASNMGGGSGSSSSGGGSGSGGVQDVRVNGTSVVQDGIARVEVPTDTVTESEMNTAISTAVSGKANQSDLESLATVVSGKANTSDVNSALVLKADKTEIPEIEANPSDAATDTLNKIDIDGTVYQLAGGTEVEANPSESATDDLETIKIGDTVYDISGGGSSTNYGKFKCDVLFNTPTEVTNWNNPIEVCSEEKTKEYDMLYIVSHTYTGRELVESVLVDTIKPVSDNFYILSPRTNSNVSGCSEFWYLGYNNSKLCWYSSTGNPTTLYKVYGLKFENKLINRSDIYSEEEVMIGRWTDGKPLYQKTWNFGKQLTIPVNTWTTISQIIGIPFESVISAEGVQYPSNASVLFDTWYDGTNLKLMTLRNGNDYIGSLTLRYTKTTDTPDSGVIPEDPMFISDPMIYSEEEQVVGSWTDGKPLYQKTIVWDNPTLGRVDNLPHGINNVDHIHILWWKAGSITGIDNTDSNYWADVWLCSDMHIYYRLGPSWGESIKPLIVTFQYTKTTDSILSGPKKGKIVQRSDIYSEEERLVGRWTDGKPLYQKTIKNIGVTLQSYTWTNTGIPFTGIDHWEVTFNKSTSSDYDNQYPMLYRYYNGNFEAFCQYTMPLDELTLQYTKTTDLPFSKQLIEDPQFVMMSDIYSEDEQVVGRWTDGKPVYQKTIVKDLTLSSSWQNYYDLTGIDLVNVEIDKLIRDGEPIPLAFSNIGVGSWIKRDGYLKFCVQGSQASEGWALKAVTIRYTKTTDVPGTGPTKGNLIYLPALYSEEEREVGVWTDGKPLYQKVAEVNITSGALNVWVNHNIPGLSDAELIHYDYDILFLDPSLGKNGSYDSTYKLEVCRLTTTQYYVIAGSGWNTGNIKVRFIIQYTKTTDQPGSGTWTPEGQLAHHYSTSEKIVGTWIDGSTVYERTWTGLSIATNTSWHSTGIDVSFANRIIGGTSIDDAGQVITESYAHPGYNDLLARSMFTGNTIVTITLQYTKSSS